MKKLKYLPAMLMLVLCVGILAIGIYAIQPSKNTISGTITVNASSAEIGIQVYHTAVHADNLIKEYETVRSGVDIPLTHEALDYTMENVNSLTDVNETPKKVIFKITNKSGKDLGGYFFNPDSTLVDGKATKANIDTDVTLDGKGENANGEEVTETGLLKATFSGYTLISAKDPADETKNGSAEIEISFELLKFVSYDMTIDLSEFNIQLNIEDYNSDIYPKQEFVVHSNATTPFDIELIQDQAQVATLNSADDEQTLDLSSLIFGENMPTKSVYSIKVTNKSEDQSLGVYFHTGDLPTEDGTAEKGTQGVKAGYASADNILLEANIVNKDNKDEVLATVTLDPYSYIAKQNTTDNYDEIEMEMVVTLTDNYTSSKTGYFTFQLCIEPYVGNMAESDMSKGSGTTAGTSFNGQFLKLNSEGGNVPERAFYNNDNIKYLVIPSGWNIYTDESNYQTHYNFYDCDSLVAISGSINTAGSHGDVYQPFGSCNELTYLKLVYMRSCQSNLFFGSKIRHLVLPRTVTSISEGMFQNLKYLETIFIPSSVSTITDYVYGIGVFTGCPGSLIIYCEASEKPTNWVDRWNAESYTDDTVNSRYTVVWGVDRFGNTLN